MSINKWFKRQLSTLAFATASVEKATLNKQSFELESESGTHQRLNQGTLADALVQGEITQEVKNLRWRIAKVLDASDKMIVTSLSVDDEGYHTLDVEAPNPIGMRVALRKVKTDDYDDYPLEMVVDNNPIILSGLDSMSDDIEEYDLSRRMASIKGDRATIGEIKSDDHQLIKNERAVNVVRDFPPKFKIENFTKKLNVRIINDSERLLEFYISKYPDQYDRKTNLLIANIKKAIINPRTSDMLDILSINFVTYKTIGVKDFYKYDYKVISFDKIIEYNGFYVIKFKSEVITNGEYLLEKYREKGLDENYLNKKAKK